ncbi:hypothetical protein JX265_008987 [Neoarthrinium moseri]|uniref:Nephrocystin 3-like N-terminal domain-containing protein n=1 Tax=Neoarthrinium moseri TaxID=1658444 RepID=A0A9Q0AM03_9PEZI|nr:uncharacterized protein JN550_007857 [Neoarthrinium moseri]KAI1862941.1 hypothetical protein JX265_008987 [Neoarthrinium moseri]KAI1866168.1 hypothetical protein JN550_007857 [Neoarthrinium moseri]
MPTSTPRETKSNGRFARFCRKIGRKRSNLETSDVIRSDQMAVSSHLTRNDKHTDPIVPFSQAPGGRRSSISTQHTVAGGHLSTDVVIMQDNSDTDHIDAESLALDIWSAAYREAVENSPDERIQKLILKGENAGQLLRQLEHDEDGLVENSLFRRGIHCLKTVQEPTVGTAFGVLKSVTAVAISVSSLDRPFAQQIANMLRQVPIIDECDILGQKLEKSDGIHDALVLVYTNLLDFYVAAFETLTASDFKFVKGVIVENQRMPGLVSEFLDHVKQLKSHIGNATLRVVQELKDLIKDTRIETLLRTENTRLQDSLHDKWQHEKQRAQEACSWFVNEPLFLDWFHSTKSELLLFCCNLGSGKTVTMSYVIDTIIQRNQNELPRALINYHYCKSDNTGDSIKIYSNLVLQLLNRQKALKKNFLEWEREVRSLGIHSPTDNVRKLGQFYLDSVAGLDRPLFIIIDGLDECDQDSRDQLLELFQEILQGKSRVKILCSTRPMPSILKKLGSIAQIRHTPDKHRDDILVEHFVRQKLGDRDPEVQELVTNKLSEMVQGSAIWVQMTVKYIQASGTHDFYHMRELLRTLPPPEELSTMYYKLFTSSIQDQGDNRLIASSALEVLAVCCRPLSIDELEWAVAMVTRKDIVTVEDLRKAVNPKRVMTLIGPFIDQFDEGDRKKRQIRVVHQSLKEVVIQNEPMSWSSHEYRLSPADESPFPRKGQLEAKILQGCVRYLLLHEIDTRSLLSEKDQDIATLRSAMPFGTMNDIDEDEDTEGKYIGEETFDPMDIGFGGFFTLWLFREAMSHWDKSENKERDLLFAFLVGLARKVVDIMVEKQWGNELLCQVAKMGCLPIIEMLFDEAAHNAGLKEELLRDRIRDPQARPGEWGTHQSVGEAVLHNHVNIVVFLLEQEGIDAHKRHSNKNGYIVLHLLARNLNPEMVQLLASHLQEDINQVENDETALTRILFSTVGAKNRFLCAQILLQAGADPAIPDNRPFRRAVKTNDYDMCRLMVDIGHADHLSVMAKDEKGHYYLKDHMHDRTLEPAMIRDLCSLARLVQDRPPRS